MKEASFKRGSLCEQTNEISKQNIKTAALKKNQLTFESNLRFLTLAGAHSYKESLFCVSRDDCVTASVTESLRFLFKLSSMMLKNDCNPNKICMNDFKSCWENTSASKAHYDLSLRISHLWCNLIAIEIMVLERALRDVTRARSSRVMAFCPALNMIASFTQNYGLQRWYCFMFKL